MQGLSRRGFLYGAAGVAAAATLPSSLSARAAVTSAARAAVTPLAGDTITPGTYGTQNAVDAANIADGYIGLPLALTIQKYWVEPSAFTQPTPERLTQLSASGCQFLISAQPSQQLSATEQSQLAAWLAMLKNDGIKFRVVLWSECNRTGFSSAQDWFRYWQYYAPVVKEAGISCGYCPGCGFAPEPALEYFPSNPAPDELWMDFYTTGFRRGSRLDQLLALAQSKGLPTAGLAEWGWEAGNPVTNPITMPWWNEYCSYLINLAEEGHFGLGAILFGSKHETYTYNIIHTTSDPRIPMIRKVSDAVTAG